MRELATLCLLLANLFEGGMSGGAGATGTYGQQMQMPVVNIAAPSGGGATPAIVQVCHNSDQTTGPTLGCVFPGNVTAGNALVLCAEWTNNDAASVTFNGGGTQASIFDKIWDFETKCIVSTGVTGGSTTITATYNATTRFRVVIGMEVTNLAASPVDQVDDAIFTSGSATMTTNSVTPTQNGELIVGVFSIADSGLTITAVAPYTMQVTDTPNQPIIGMETQVQTTAASVSASATMSTAGFDYIPVIFTLKHI